MAEQLDTSKGWCCQPPGKQINDLPADGQRKARKRMDQAVSR